VKIFFLMYSIFDFVSVLCLNDRTVDLVPE